jgi:hypothetical protein
MNLFNWSLPFLIDKVAEILEYTIDKNTILTQEEIANMKSATQNDMSNIIEDLLVKQKEQEEEKINKIKAKVFSVGRVVNMMKSNSETEKADFEKRMSISGDGRIDANKARRSIVESKDENALFVNIRNLDHNNEKFPIVTFNRRESLKQGISPE